MNCPSDSRNAIRTPLSPVIFGSRSPSLFVPTKTMPPETTALPYDCEPSWATHLTFFFVLTSQLDGRPFMLETMLRSGVPPHMGQSPEPGSEAETTGTRAQTAALSRLRKMIALDFVLLILICLRTPLCCRNKVPRGRYRIIRARPGDLESGRCVQSSTRWVQARWR